MKTEDWIPKAHGIPDDHWLNEEQYKWFRRGYEYAATQTKAIPVLSKVGPGELFFAVWAIMRGAGIKEPDSKKQGAGTNSAPS